ncbi:hypothetical protein EYF80_041443 [Liparis tanakae]|uniref:Uncharacterized protein n=1 Tax=Liparis tanakae TaxID=230148 RepID=A0A4Z2G6F7_9TELE|nr:hypothetical protein EYF80_041443 [Liparis tanakae]
MEDDEGQEKTKDDRRKQREEKPRDSLNLDICSQQIPDQLSKSCGDQTQTSTVPPTITASPLANNMASAERTFPGAAYLLDAGMYWEQNSVHHNLSERVLHPDSCEHGPAGQRVDGAVHEGVEPNEADHLIGKVFGGLDPRIIRLAGTLKETGPLNTALMSAMLYTHTAEPRKMELRGEETREQVKATEGKQSVVVLMTVR